MNRITALILSACLLLAPVTAWTAPPITGPVAAKVVKVYDGDTFTVEAYPWPGITAKASVRVNGVDTPEIRGKCESEKRKAIAAREFVKWLVLGEVVFLQNVKYGKYAGRVVADVKLKGGDSLADKIINQGLGREYHGGKGGVRLNDENYFPKR
ncbi:MAG: thermonuclease family protein [Nitrospinae bacterium]|nr:thermonuclease family protein [Nitrospinota bacterium]